MARMPRRKLIDRTVKLGVSYARYSTDRQTSVEQQHSTNDEVAEEFGVRVVKRFSDRAVSRSVDDRDEMEAMFAYLEAHPEVGCIVVNELERLTAGITQRARVTELCRRLQITMLTEDMGDIDPDDEEKMHMADERSVSSEGELIRVRRRTKRHMKALVNQPGKFVMRPCYGMRLASEPGPEGRPFELHPQEHPWLLRIFEQADLGLSDSAIAKWLVEGGARTKTGKLNWSVRAVKLILENDFYKGVYEWGANEVRRSGPTKYLEPRPDIHPNRVTRPSPLGAMVDVEQWDRVNARRLARAENGDNRYRQTGRRVLAEQLFDGRVFCGRCGYRMYGQFDRERADGITRAPFRYTCKAVAAPSRVTKGGVFGPPCTESQSITESQIVAVLAAFGPETRFHAVDPHRNDLHRVTARQEAAAGAVKAKARFERVKAMHLDDPDLATLADVKAQKAKWDAARRAVQDLGRPDDGPAAVPRYLTEVNWADAAAVLSDETLPVGTRRALLATGGLARIYVDSPVVRPQFADR